MPVAGYLVDTNLLLLFVVGSEAPGLDAVLLEAATADTPLLTMDFQLYAAGLAKGVEVAVNFTAYR